MQNPTMQKINGTLKISVFGARDLKKRGFLKMDPYCIVELMDLEHRTEAHKKGNCNPQWGQSFEFQLKDVDEKEEVHFLVYDKEVLKDDKIGRADLTLSKLASICQGGECDIELVSWGALVRKHKPAGYMRISATFEGSGWPIQGVSTGLQNTMVGQNRSDQNQTQLPENRTDQATSSIDKSSLWGHWTGKPREDRLGSTENRFSADHDRISSPARNRTPTPLPTLGNGFSKMPNPYSMEREALERQNLSSAQDKNTMGMDRLNLDNRQNEFNKDKPLV